MAVQLIISFLVTLSIVASGLLLANAQKAVKPTKPPAQAAATQTQPGSATTENSDKKSEKASETKATPAKATVPEAAEPAKKKPQPLMMELSTVRDTFRAREDMMVKAELWAMQPVTICVYPNSPEASFSADLFRAGYGKVETLPPVLQLSQKDLRSVERIHLEPGQMHRVVFNMKKVVPMPPSFWKTGEYRVQVKFYLCGKTESAEEEIHSQGPLHLLVLE